MDDEQGATWPTRPVVRSSAPDCADWSPFRPLASDSVARHRRSRAYPRAVTRPAEQPVERAATERAGDVPEQRMVRPSPAGPLLAVREFGGDARPFLLVHGLASNARVWDGVARILAAHGHRVAAVDLRGHGLSEAPDDGYDTDTAADDLAGLADALDLRSP